MKGPRPLFILAVLAALAWLARRREESVAGSRVRQVVADFKAKLGPIAAKVQSETGVAASIGMAQAAHESAWGASGLTAKANNLFGFTAELGTYWRTRGLPFVEMPTTEWKKDASGKAVAYKTTRPFRAYATWEESYRDWVRLMGTDAYNKVGAMKALKAGDMQAFAQAMKAAGYATDPDYAGKLVRVDAEMRGAA